jgi:WD40 repeat protein
MIESKTTLFKTKVPVNTSYFLNEDLMVIEFEDQKLILYYISDQKKFNITGHTGIVRSVDKNPVKDEFATAGRDKLINIYELSQKNQDPIKTFVSKDRVNAIKYTGNGKQIIAALNDGSIYLWNIETGQSKLLEKKEGVRALSIGQNRKRDILAVGFEDGSLVMFYPNQNFNKKNFLVSNTGIKSIDISSTSQLLSISKENRKVDINYLNDMNQNILKIMDSDLKVKYLLFSNDDRLYGLCEDNTIRFWEKSNKVYANVVKYMIKRDFTPEEWKLYVGPNIKYEKILNK